MLFRSEKKYYLTGYPNELGQSILNITNNAKDALLLNNAKGIKDKHIIITLKEEAKYVCITIEDNAGGIPLNILNTIFNKYFSTKGKEGTGLGLHISKTIIETHMNGKLSVYNNNEGACFEIILLKD